LEAVTIADLTVPIVWGFFSENRLSDFSNFELQITSDRHRRSGHINFWRRSDRRSGSINFLPIYGQTVSLSIQNSAK